MRYIFLPDETFRNLTSLFIGGNECIWTSLGLKRKMYVRKQIKISWEILFIISPSDGHIYYLLLLQSNLATPRREASSAFTRVLSLISASCMKTEVLYFCFSLASPLLQVVPILYLLFVEEWSDAETSEHGALQGTDTHSKAVHLLVQFCHASFVFSFCWLDY